jgi:hypothetical protein
LLAKLGYNVACLAHPQSAELQALAGIRVLSGISQQKSERSKSMGVNQIYVANELFVGRSNEQEQFRNVLRKVLAIKANSDVSPFIFLIYGEGGMGKTQLTRRLFDIVTVEPPFERDFFALRLDWQIERYKTITLRVARDQIQPETVFDVLYQAALDKNWGNKFQAYRDTLKKLGEVEQQITQALDEDDQYAAIRDLGANGLAKLVRQAVPIIGQPGEDFSQAVLAATVQAGAETLAHLRKQAIQFLKAKLKPESYEMYRNPLEQLAQALGNGFKSVSRERPLIVLLDTYEVISVVDPWLRRIIKFSGPRVIWVIAGRDNLATNRPGDRYFIGYNAEFPHNLFTWNMRELAIEHLTTYFADRVPDRPLDHQEAIAIYHATHGVPLAIRQSVDLWIQGVPLTEIIGESSEYVSRDKIVREMHYRVLLHLETDALGEDDKRTLYLLAMQPRPDSRVQQAVLSIEKDKFDLGRYLAELAHRYSTVQLEGGARLHDAMRDFVQEYLMMSEMRHRPLRATHRQKIVDRVVDKTKQQCQEPEID